MKLLVVSWQNMECCSEYIHFPSKDCTDVNISIKHFISMKTLFQNANSSTENFPAALPKKLPSSNINSLQKKKK